MPRGCLRLWPYREATERKPAVYDSRFFWYMEGGAGRKKMQKLSCKFLMKLDITEAIAQRSIAPHGQ